MITSIRRIFKVLGHLFVLRSAHVCPRCHQSGYGIFGRWAKSPKFGPYQYFAHPTGHGSNRTWCYLGREIFGNEEEM